MSAARKTKRKVRRAKIKKAIKKVLTKAKKNPVKTIQTVRAIVNAVKK
jgi:hypothetical protein